MKKKFWVVNQTSATTGEMLLYGFIGSYEEIDDMAFIADLRAMEAVYSNIDFRINCGGGNVYKGLAIFNAIRNSKAKTTSRIDGIAASMGAIVALATNETYMSKYARFMTHRVTAYTGGNADDIRNFATEMDQLETVLASIISENTGLSVEDAKTKYITNQDRWIGAEQALEEKVITGIYDAAPIAFPANQTDTQQLFNAFNKVYNLTNLNDMKLIAVLLGLPENATEAQIEAKVKELQQAKTNAENALQTSNKLKAKSLVDVAINNKQLVEADRAEFEALAESNYDVAAKTIAKIIPAKKPNDLLNRQAGKVDNDAEDNVDADTWENLVKKGAGAVATLKKTDPVKYCQLFKANYGFEPTMD